MSPQMILKAPSSCDTLRAPLKVHPAMDPPVRILTGTVFQCSQNIRVRLSGYYWDPVTDVHPSGFSLCRIQIASRGCGPQVNDCTIICRRPTNCLARDNVAEYVSITMCYT